MVHDNSQGQTPVCLELTSLLSVRTFHSSVPNCGCAKKRHGGIFVLFCFVLSHQDPGSATLWPIRCVRSVSVEHPVNELIVFSGQLHSGAWPTPLPLTFLWKQSLYFGRISHFQKSCKDGTESRPTTLTLSPTVKLFIALVCWSTARLAVVR